MKIIALDGYTLDPGDNPWDEVSTLGDFSVYDRTEGASTIERGKDADIIITNKVPLTRLVLDQLPNLKFITVTATGYDIVDGKAAEERGIPVSNVPVYGTETVAQYVMSLVLQLARQPALHDRAVKQGEWSKQPYWSFWKTPLIELAGRTMGIVGFGNLHCHISQNEA